MKKLFFKKRNLAFGYFSLLIILIALPLAAQNYNPPFPRLAFQRPGGIGGGALDHFMARFDFVVHGGGISSYNTTQDLNASIRQLYFVDPAGYGHYRHYCRQLLQ
ncbi:hypothetical protein JXO59_02965 [candidate division KSB1 bacterium]|nr:hypothetical protein [candidate division KSB1 bacterium]